MIDAKEYGRALFMLAEESGKTERILSDVNVAKEAFSQNPEYEKLLDTPALPKEEKLALIDKAFEPLDEFTVNLIKLLCERHSVHLFCAAADAFCVEYDSSRGIERVEAVTAISMTEAQISAIKAKLEAMTGKTVIIRSTVDRSILGGVKLRYMGIQLDGSVKTRLDGFEKALSNIVI